MKYGCEGIEAGSREKCRTFWNSLDMKEWAQFRPWQQRLSWKYRLKKRLGIRIYKSEYCWGLWDEEVGYSDCHFLVTLTAGKTRERSAFGETCGDLTSAHTALEGQFLGVQSVETRSGWCRKNWKIFMCEDIEVIRNHSKNIKTFFWGEGL